MADQKTPPIVPQDYIAGVKIVDIGDLRVARGMSRRPVSVCKHSQLVYDRHERRVWCKECETDIEAFDAFELLVGNFSAASDRLERREERVREAEKHSLISRASKAFDEAWRTRNMSPCCPHCKAGLLPEDIVRGFGLEVGTEFERARRQALSRSEKE